MKKLFILSLMLIALPALAATICADDDVIAIVLDPEIASTDLTYNTALSEWGAKFSYGSIWGIATCTDKEGTQFVAVDELRSKDGELATGGESKGQSCWCKMTHPAVSSWVFQDTYLSIDDCKGACAYRCSHYSAYYRAFRASMFGSTAH